MPRDSSGVYRLPAGNPVVPDTIIESVWANTTLGDVANALTGSLPRSGVAPMLGPLTLSSDAITQPLQAASKAYVDNFLAYATGMPLGAITAYATNGAPTGWLLCDGQAVSRTAYPALFTAIGTIYGTGDGTTTFNVPDLRNEFIRGLGTQTLGVHNPASLAAHGHGITDTGHTHPLGGHTHAFVTGTANEVAGQSHAHGVNDAGHSHGYTTLTSGTGTAAGSGVAQTASTNTTTNDTGISIQSTSTNHTHSGTTAAPTVDSSANITGITVQNSTGAETVPQNVAMRS